MKKNLHLTLKRLLPGISLTWLLLSIYLLCLVGCGGQQNNIVGKWTYTSNKNGYDAFFYDLEFYEDGTMFTDSPFLMSNTFNYSFPSEGKLKLAVGGLGDVFSYSLEGDTLRIYFENEGYNEYRRSSTGSVAPTKERVFERATITPQPPTPANGIVGKWIYTSNKNGYDAFYYDLEFYQDGTMYTRSPFLLTNTFQYSFPAEGRLKLAVGGMGDVFDYTLEGDTLRIYFEKGGYNEYRRSSNGSQVPAQDQAGNLPNWLYQLQFNSIQPGVGMAGIKLGYTESQVIQLLGSPSDTFPVQDNNGQILFYAITYNSNGIFLGIYLNLNKLVENFRVYDKDFNKDHYMPTIANYPGATIGITREALIQEMGQPRSTNDHVTCPQSLGDRSTTTYKYKGVSLWVCKQNNLVYLIDVP